MALVDGGEKFGPVFDKELEEVRPQLDVGLEDPVHLLPGQPVLQGVSKLDEGVSVFGQGLGSMALEDAGQTRAEELFLCACEIKVAVELPKRQPIGMVVDEPHRAADGQAEQEDRKESSHVSGPGFQDTW